jgi:hypothetical protein
MAKRLFQDGVEVLARRRRFAAGGLGCIKRIGMGDVVIRVRGEGRWNRIHGRLRGEWRK